MIANQLDLTSITNRTDDKALHKISPLHLVQIVVSLLLITIVIHWLNIEVHMDLLTLMPLVIAGFITNNILSLSYRLPFLFLLTVAGAIFLLGIKDGLLLVSLGLLLFSVAHLPVSFRLRVAATLIIAGILALSRMGWVPYLDRPMVISILGSMFMFRMILYMYEYRLSQKNANIWYRINYFFLLPNLFFLIFPVVDYKTFISSHFTTRAVHTYRRGIVFIINGVFHLFLYRIIYYYMIPSPEIIDSLSSFLYFSCISFVLIVRLAGIFHFSAGVICLFGFDLPATFHHYFFAPNFNELWRRINIYWRDFVIKVFFYPIYFKVKKIGIASGILVTVMIVFMINWLLHSYQWFWIKGYFPVTIQDAVFWSSFGIAVGINSYIQNTKPRKQPTQIDLPPLKASVNKCLSILGVFIFMSVVYTFWTTEDIEGWMTMFRSSSRFTWSNIFTLLAYLGLVFTLLVSGDLLLSRLSKKGINPFKWPYHKKFYIALATVSILAAISSPKIVNLIESRTDFDMDPVIHTRLNQVDLEKQFIGYYETLLPNDRVLDTPLDNLNEERDESWRPLSELGGIIENDNMFLRQLKPNLDIVFKDQPFRTNDLGLHDRPYSRQKPIQSIRMAILGGSIEMGGGVPFDLSYSNILEDHMNAQKGDGQSMEVLNFGVANNHIFNQIPLIDQVLSDLEIDIIMYTAHLHEHGRMIRNLDELRLNYDISNYPFLLDLFDELGIDNNTNSRDFKKSMLPYENEIIEWAYRYIYDQTIALGATPLWVYIPAVAKSQNHDEASTLTTLAERIGYSTYNLVNAFDDEDMEKLMLAPWDRHFSQKAHEVVGTELHKQLRTSPAIHDFIQPQKSSEDE